MLLRCRQEVCTRVQLLWARLQERLERIEVALFTISLPRWLVLLFTFSCLEPYALRLTVWCKAEGASLPFHLLAKQGRNSTKDVVQPTRKTSAFQIAAVAPALPVIATSCRMQPTSIGSWFAKLMLAVCLIGCVKTSDTNYLRSSRQ